MSDTIKSQTSEEPSTPRVFFFHSTQLFVNERKHSRYQSCRKGVFPGGGGAPHMKGGGMLVGTFEVNP